MIQYVFVPHHIWHMNPNTPGNHFHICVAKVMSLCARIDKREFSTSRQLNNGVFFCDKHINSHKLELQHKLVFFFLSGRVTVLF